MTVSAAPAAAGVASKSSGRSADDVRDYWTPERMRDAKPVERAKGGKPGGGSTSTSWSTLQVSWPGPAVQRAHGKVFFTDSGVGYVCSGTAVSSSNGSVVWTAGHCVNEGPGAYYDNWEFVPAYNSGGMVAPYGEWPAATLYTTTAWRTTTDAYGQDLGAARVATNGGQTLAQALGGNVRTLDFTPDTRTGDSTVNPVDAYGYPAAGKFSGQTMYVCDTYVSRLDGSTSPPTYGMPCGMTGGSSGGGWVDPDTGQVFSVVSYGYQGLKNMLFGPQQGTTASSLLATAGA